MIQIKGVLERELVLGRFRAFQVVEDHRRQGKLARYLNKQEGGLTDEITPTAQFTETLTSSSISGGTLIVFESFMNWSAKSVPRLIISPTTSVRPILKREYSKFQQKQLHSQREQLENYPNAQMTRLPTSGRLS